MRWHIEEEGGKVVKDLDYNNQYFYNPGNIHL
jgi:hypothetical protein